MNILIMASMGLDYFPINSWLDNDMNKYCLFIRKEHEESYEQLKGDSRFEILSFTEWEKNSNIELEAIRLNLEKNFDKILSIRESDVQRVARLRDYLSIPGQREKGADLFRDKFLMKKFLSNNGVDVPNFARVNNVIDIISFIDRNGFPVVLKPISGAGSVDTNIIRNKNELHEVIQNLDIQNFIIEKFVEGEVHHIDGIVLNNTLKFISVSKYVNDCLSYKKNESTASIFLLTEDNISVKLENYGKKILNLMPCPESYSFHLEVFLDGDKVVFCEIACRTGGGRITECVQKLFNFNLTAEVIKHECGYTTEFKGSNEIYKIKNPVGWVLSSPMIGKLEYMPTEIEFEWVFDFWKFAKIGNVFSGSNSSVFATAAFSVEGNTNKEVVDRLLFIDKWFKDNSVYKLD